MIHGIQSFFAERERNARRLSLLAVLTGCAMFVALWIARVPPLQRMVDRAMRFGVMGEDRDVHFVLLPPLRSDKPELRDMGTVLEHSARRGSDPARRIGRSGEPTPENRTRVPGPGNAAEDLLTRAYSRRSDLSVVQSKDMVIERRVEPVYPPHALEHDIEGRVVLMALVDTSGHVVEVQLIEGAVEAQREFAQAASDAVWQWRFQPDRRHGVAREVYVPVAFNFHIDRVY
jgi:TonB family protein